MKKLALVVAFCTLAFDAWAQGPTVMGTWLTASGVAKVRIGPCANTASGAICGFIVGLVNPKGPDGQIVAPEVATDYRNADPALRSRKVIGMPLIWGFKKGSEPNTYEGGQIYNGENGKIYSANINLQPDGKLRLRGYVGSPMFGETQIWTRVE
ncbi:MAG: DUF2147 domain-containing protein [Alphaproteobacteria bacterium]|nr:DUF2147 domain-containing protein [Alphaproteobacteria bacterium]